MNADNARTLTPEEELIALRAAIARVHALCDLEQHDHYGFMSSGERVPCLPCSVRVALERTETQPDVAAQIRGTATGETI